MTHRPFLIAIALLVGGTAEARRAPEWNYDLAGLVLQSDAVVVADRGAPTRTGVRYHVIKSVRGAIAAGTELELDDRDYDTAGIDARTIVFVKTAGQATYLVPSGLRVTIAGKVFRYEQGPLQSPTRYVRVPQGHDPSDHWQSGVTAVDQQTFERDLAAAIGRVDALPLAVAERDHDKRRAALLALLPPPTDARAGGAFADLFAERVVTALADAHDAEGALLAYQRQRSTYANPGSIPFDAAVAIAKDAAKPVALRVTAIRAIRNHTSFYANVKAVEAMIGLISDPARDVRAAVAEVTILHGSYDARTRSEKATFQRLYKDARKALTRQFTVETDPTALAAITSALEMYPNTAPLPARAAAPLLAGRLEVFQDLLGISVSCLHTGAILRDPKLIALRDGKPVTPMMPSTIYTRCDDRAGDARAGVRTRLAPGHYTLSVDVDVNGKRVVLDLGALDSLADGELAIVRP